MAMSNYYLTSAFNSYMTQSNNHSSSSSPFCGGSGYYSYGPQVTQQEIDDYERRITPSGSMAYAPRASDYNASHAVSLPTFPFNNAGASFSMQVAQPQVSSHAYGAYGGVMISVQPQAFSAQPSSSVTKMSHAY